jgi:hypothetical protein
VAASALPGAMIVILQAVANSVLTGEATAAGAVAKLELYHPYLSGAQIFDSWWQHIEYQVLRVTQHHLSATPALGWIAWALAAASLFDQRTRRIGALLWASAALWIVVVALNGQVRWQNERYTMPALAWLLIAAALGLAALLTRRRPDGARGRPQLGGAIVAVAAAALLAWQQQPRFRDQVWFFGRASRNILDQHVRAGTLLRAGFAARPARVLVGDAGAIPYAADVAALDIIGLGGYRGLPFARATRLGLGAALELIERMPLKERPDAMALYPSWWGTLPLWFGRRIAEVPVRGNVICGGMTKVIYQPDWSSFDGSAQPFTLRPAELVVDELDLADLISEKAHGYRLSKRAIGFIDMKLLPHPNQRDRDVFDAGRIVPGDVSESFTLRGFSPERPVRLVFRSAPTHNAAFFVRIDGRAPEVVELTPSDGWVEMSVEIPGESVGTVLRVQLEPARGERRLFHVWGIQPR